ncbi:C-type lectin domain family 4 member E-like [Silurus meridionalis]|nr:C-type lectin domain family 4 member E-like [Silurus meridionalis]
MSDLDQNYVNFAEKRGEYIERVVEIYDNVDAVRGQDLKEVTEDINVKKNLQTKHTGGTAWGRCFSLTAVSVLLLLLCILLLTVVTVLLLKNNKLDTEKNQFQSSYNTMNTERERLQTSNDKMRLQINQLQFQKDQLLLQRDHLEQQKSSLKNMLLKLGCGFFSSSIYCISDVKKAWSESRQDCINNGADLVIINSTEEQEFISKRFGNAEAWIGLSDTEIEGNFKWVDGTLLTTSFWWNGEPNDYGGNEDCAITGYKFAKFNISTWADFPCDFPGFGICEMKIFN